MVAPVSGTVEVCDKPGVNCRSSPRAPSPAELDRSTRARASSSSARSPPPAWSQTAKFYDGMFKVTQSGATTDLTLNEPLAPCAKKKQARGRGEEAQVPHACGATGKGKFRTRGQYSAATIRGTKWLVQDSCAGTLTQVKQGVVSVRDNVKGKTITLRAGKRYHGEAALTLADHDVVRADAGAEQPARGLHDRAVALGHRQRDAHAVGVRRLLAHALERDHRGERRGRMRQCDLQSFHPTRISKVQDRICPQLTIILRLVSETTSSRLLTLLSLLQGRRDWPGSELADRLEVSGRTVRRDVERLRSLGYPVESMTGPAGGYQLRAGTAMPPLLLDDDEAIAIAVGLRTAAGGSVSGIEETAVRALVKLEQVLPSHLRRRVQALSERDADAAGLRRPAGRPAVPDRARRRLPRPRARALRLHRARPRRHAPRGRAALARQRRPPLVPRRLRLRPRRLAHVPRRPDREARVHRRALHTRASCRPRTPPPTSRRACSPTPRATRRA